VIHVFSIIFYLGSTVYNRCASSVLKKQWWC